MYTFINDSFLAAISDRGLIPLNNGQLLFENLVRRSFSKATKGMNVFL